eukprot:s49_g52.t1
MSPSSAFNSKFSWLFIINWLAARATWSLVTERLGPSPRFGHTAAWGKAHGRRGLIVHAGSGEALLDDLWVFDPSTSTWTNRSYNDHNDYSLTPPQVHRHAMVWDPHTEVLWISGGFDGNNFLKEIWKYDSGSAGSAGSGWLRVVDSTVPGPCARSDHVAMWDATSSAIWIHGGFDGTVRRDLWKFDTREGTWSRMPQTGRQPSARANHVAAWDDTHQAIWIHAGHAGSEGLQRDLWRFSTSTSTWYLISNSGPTARAYHVSAWDPLNHILWVHGGKDVAPRRDLWSFDTVNYKWELIEDHSGPSRRFDHVAAWDVGTMSLWIHGGYEGSVLQDLWKYEIPTTTTTTTTTVEDLTACLVLLPIATVLTAALVVLVAYWWRKRFKRCPTTIVLPVPPSSETHITIPLPPPPPPDGHIITVPPTVHPKAHITVSPWPPSPAPAPLQTFPLTVCRFPKNTQRLQPPADPPERPAASCDAQLELCVPDLTDANPFHANADTPAPQMACPQPLFLHPEHALMHAPLHVVPNAVEQQPPESRDQRQRRWPCIPRPTQSVPALPELATHEYLHGSNSRMSLRQQSPLKDRAVAQNKPLRAPVPSVPSISISRERSWSHHVAIDLTNLVIDKIEIPLKRPVPKSSNPPALQQPQQDFFNHLPSPKPQLPRQTELASLAVLKQHAKQKGSSRSSRCLRSSRSRSRSSGALKSTLGGPWYTVRYTPAITPGPGHYDPEHPGVFGRIPGLQPGFPKSKKSDQKSH